jgi:hypothetical protein
MMTCNCDEGWIEKPSKDNLGRRAAPMHDCAYVAAVNALIPTAAARTDRTTAAERLAMDVAKSKTEREIARSVYNSAWDRTFARAMAELTREAGLRC